MLDGAAGEALRLLWMAPLLSGGGYSSEAIAFALGLRNLTRRDASAATTTAPPGVSFSVRQFAEQADGSFLSGLPRSDARQLESLFAAGRSTAAARGVVVCHSTPDAWVPSKFPGWDEVAPCPPPEARIKVSGGRAARRGQQWNRRFSLGCASTEQALWSTAAQSERRL
jgi:hypothetical protein